MEAKNWEITARQHLEYLCNFLDSRRIGSPGNQLATAYAAEILDKAGFQVETPVFACMDWLGESASLSISGENFSVQPSPYSLGCRTEARLQVLNSIETLENSQITGKIVLLAGDLAKEQIMPKNFEFYNPEEHQRIIQLLELKKPAAIITAASLNPELAGALYPYPMFEDGDFDIPSVFTTVEEGEHIVRFDGKIAWLESLCRRIPSIGCNVIAYTPAKTGRRIVLSAHIDAKLSTPGALDNASGVVTLLLLARMLADYQGEIGVEILLFNGEDYYSSPGEMQYLRQHKTSFDQILMNINLDLVGAVVGKTAYSFYDLPADLNQSVEQVFETQDHLVKGNPWYQGDHMVFVMNQVPALALVSERMEELLQDVVHTAGDSLDKIDPKKLVQIASSLKLLLRKLGQGS